MNSTFGTRLRLQRERQQISLTAIAEQTKIKLSFLEALERDDVSHWPLGIFGRSYIRAYAQAVGLDPGATVREFVECHPGRIESLPAALSERPDVGADHASRRPPIRLQFLIDSAIDAFQTRRAELGQRTGPAIEKALTTAQPFALDLSAVAHLCTRLGCAQEAHEVTSALEDAASVLHAVGVILWIPDGLGVALTPVFAHGYSDEMIAHLPRVSADANNASAEAFRTRTTCVVNGGDLGTGAVVAPLLTPTGCAGVLALELRNGAEQREDVRAAVTILAAQISTLVGYSVLAHTLSA